MNKRNKIIVSIVGITIVLLALLGITYAYYLTRIEGNTNTNSISITTANLKLTYGDGNTEILTSDTLLMPGEFEGTKDFTVTNNGNASVTYGVILEDMINPLSRPQDMKMILSCSSSNVDGGCSGLDEMNLPSTNEFLVENTIEVGETHIYELKLRYIEAGEDQSIDMGKTISGKLNIIDSHDTVDMTGVVANYEEGDYVQVNSEPKISYITKDGKYKVVGLRPEEHTIAVYNRDGTLKGDRELTIKSGTSESISENEITITKDTRTIRMNVTAINADNTITTGSAALDKYNPFKSGTLAYEILNNANNVTEEEKTLGYAEYMPVPPTRVAYDITKYLYVDDGLNETEQTYKLVYNTTGNLNYYYAYADSYDYEYECYDYDDEDCYYYYENFTLKNNDGSPVSINQGYSSLKGKYVIDVWGDAYEEDVYISDEWLYYVVDVIDDTIYYVSVDENGPIYNYEKYYTYGDSYKFDEEKGTYTIYNSDGSNIKSIKYIDGYNNILINKYVYSTYGNDTEKSTYSSNTSIYKILDTSTNRQVHYNSSSKHTIPNEFVLSQEFDDYGLSYYYRGVVTNNYLNFAGMCWKIVRIEGDGSIKLILEDQDQECIIADGNWNIPTETGSSITTGTFGFVEISNGIKKMNYLNPTYEPSTAMVNVFKNFQKDVLNPYLEQLKVEEWCFNNRGYDSSTKKLLSSSEAELKYNGRAGSNMYYDSYARLYYYYNNNNFNPMLKCNGVIYNKYNDSTDMYVGTLTADEIVYAGSAISKSFGSAPSYLFNDMKISWWTFSPKDLANYWGFDAIAIMSSSYYYPWHAHGGLGKASFRPSIVLKKDIGYISGDGSKNNPYVVG